jgi:hypothetical protein
LRLRNKELTFNTGFGPHLVSNTEEVVVQELKEHRLFKLDARNNFVENLVSLGFRVSCDDLDCFFKDFEWNCDLDEVLNNFKDYDLDSG